MSEAGDFNEKLYKYCEKYNFEDAEHVIAEGIEYFSNRNRYDIIDTILYTIDINKLKARIASFLYKKSDWYSDKLVMVKDFKSRIIDHFGKDNV